MPSKNKVRGNAAEAYVVNLFKDRGFEAQRAWGSDGRAMGEHEEVDVRVEHPVPQLIQVKRRKSVATYIKPSAEVHAQVLYEDGGGGKRRGVYVVLDIERYIDLLNAERLICLKEEQIDNMAEEILNLEKKIY